MQMNPNEDSPERDIKNSEENYTRNQNLGSATSGRDLGQNLEQSEMDKTQISSL